MYYNCILILFKSTALDFAVSHVTLSIFGQQFICSLQRTISLFLPRKSNTKVVFILLSDSRN